MSRHLARRRLVASAAALLVSSAIVAPSRAGMGGPDGAGYSWFDINDGCDVVDDDFMLANSDDFFDGGAINFVGPFDLGFDFPFYERVVTQVWVNRSGLIFFQEPPDDALSVADSIPRVEPIVGGGFIAAYWDLLQAEFPAVWWEQFPAEGFFKISYRMRVNLTGQVLELEVYLHESGDIRIEYLRPTDPPYQATIGMESFAETVGLEVMDRGTPNGGLTYSSPTPFSICFDRQSALPCDAFVPLSCGDTFAGSTSSVDPSTVSNYGCSLDAWDGPEAVHEITVTELSDIETTFTGTPEMSLFLLDGCDEFACIDGGTTGASGFNVTPGTYYLVVDSATPAGAGDYTIDLSCGEISQPAECGDVVFGTTVGEPNRFDSSPCLPGEDLSGPETWYTVDMPAAGDLNLTLSSSTGQSVVVLDATDAFEPESCVTAGVGGTIRYDAGPGLYLVGVDGPPGSDGSFNLDIACSSELDCGPAIELACNEGVTGDTRLATNRADFYACSPDQYSGPELVYTLNNPVDQVVSFILDDSAAPGLDLILLDGCTERGCVEVQDGTFSIDLPAGTYTAVVDGLEGAAGPFSLSIVCGSSLQPEFVSVNGASGECFVEEKTAWLTPDIPRADVLFAIDLTGSMGGERDALQDNMRDIVARLESFIADVAFGLISYKDYNATGSGTIPCSYNAGSFGGGTDYPYRLEQPITIDRPSIEAAVDALPGATGGADGPESYNRVMFETYSDPAVGWRPGSRRLLVNFGDQLPHDCNVLECLGGVGIPHGIDLGRDNMVDTGDELATLPVVQGLIDNRIVLLHLESSGFGTEGGFTFTEIWRCWAEMTRGTAVELNSDGTVPADLGIDLVELVAELIADQGSFCSTLELVAEPGFEDWLASATPVYVDVLLPTVVDFEVQICVPPATPAGTYTFTVELQCSGGVVATQEVQVEVTNECAVSVVRTPEDATICVGDAASLDASGMTVVNCDGVTDYSWDDGSGVVGTDPMLDVSPSATTTYEVTVSCSTDPSCFTTADATVEVQAPPIFEVAAARDLEDCNRGLEVSWEAATFLDATGTGVYNVYRSEASCADALTRAPVATGLRGLSWIDDATADGRTYHYVVEAEDARTSTPCLPRGADHGGAATRACVAPVVEIAGDAFPEGVGATLRMSHDGDEVTASWTDARDLSASETYRLLKATGEPTAPFQVVNGTSDTSRQHVETDTSARRQFFDLRVANGCEQLSEDEFPPGYDR